MVVTNNAAPAQQPRTIPWFGARKVARELLAEVQELQTQRDAARSQLARVAAMASELVTDVKVLRTQNEAALKQLETLGVLPVVELEARRRQLEADLVTQAARLTRDKSDAATALAAVQRQYADTRRSIVETEDLVLLQEVGIYKYRHPLTDAVAYEKQLAGIDDDIKAMTKKDGGAVLATNEWTVNGSAAKGRAMVRDFSKLMLRAFNAEADALVRGRGWCSLTRRHGEERCAAARLEHRRLNPSRRPPSLKLRRAPQDEAERSCPAIEDTPSFQLGSYKPYLTA
jgi:hypothetical protein